MSTEEPVNARLTDSEPTALGALVRDWRERALMTQEELAERARLHVRTIRRLENGDLRRPRIGSIRSLVDALALDPDEAEALAGAAAGTPHPAAGRARAGPPPDGHRAPPAVRQLPARVAGFSGREAHLRRLDGCARGESGDEAAAVVIAAVVGPAGSGKSALAVHWAHRAARRFPDGQLYADLRGYHPDGAALHPAEALRGFLEAVGVPPERMPAGTDERAALYRDRLAGRRVLVLLDNARDADQVRPLLPGSGTCVVLVTSRDQLAGLVATEGAHPVPVDVLTRAEAQQMLAVRLGPRRTAAEPEAVAEIIEHCGRLPLALAVVAARAALHPGFPLSRFAAELRAARGGLAALSGPDPRADLRAAFTWSTRVLTAPAARLFRLAGTHPGPDLGAAAAASLADLPLARVRAPLAELTGAHLLTEHAPDRYTCHELLHAHAAELSRARDDAATRHAATERLLDHYLHTGHAAATLLNPARAGSSPAPPRAGVRPEPVATHAAATAWFAAEHPVLLAAAELATRSGFHRHAVELAGVLEGFLDRCGLWADWVRARRTAVEAARRLGDKGLEARAHRALGGAHARLARPDEAYLHYGRALDLYQQVEQLDGQARTHTGLARLLAQTGRHPEALTHARRSLGILRGLADPVGLADALDTAGWCHALVGDHQRALAYCQEAIVLHQELDDRDGEAATWDTLGYAHHHLGDHGQATTCYGSAIRLYRELGDRYHESVGLVHLGDLHDLTGDPTAARTSWLRAMRLRGELGHPTVEEVRARLLGKAPARSPRSSTVA